MNVSRRVSVRAYAKLNLCLEVLNRRPDGFHNLRTVFQTISLHDVVRVEWEPARRAAVEVTCSRAIPGPNLATRAAEAAVAELRLRARIKVQLLKRIPMGGGLGGGSTDAAAVLLTLSALSGKRTSDAWLRAVAAELGSDVPFFLTGGTSLGLDRGTELYPVAEPAAKHVLIVAPNLQISTAEAYGSLARGEVPRPERANASERLLAGIVEGAGPKEWQCSNDFEAAVFPRYPELSRIKRRLQRAGAAPVLMSGSGACLFGVFETGEALIRAQQLLPEYRTFRSQFVNRQVYRTQWNRLRAF